jgi:ankyrin repeat protein
VPKDDLDRHRQEAKRLRRAYAAGDADAVRRVRAVMGESAEPPASATLLHAGALHVIAREQGQASWPRLKLALETAAMDRTQRAERLSRALYFGQTWVARALLDADPDLPHAAFGLELATYDVEAVRARLARDPALATAPAPRRPPIAHLCFSRYRHMAPERHEAMLEIAQLLVDHGADPNDSVPVEPGSAERLSMLYGALGHAGNLPLARWLLEHGADPNDVESLYHATELGHRDGVALLLAHGADPRHTNALLRAIDMGDPAMVAMLLEGGADPDDPYRIDTTGRKEPSPPALHHAARRFAAGEVVELLLDHGADPVRVWRGRDAYGTARVHGAVAVARSLEERGHGRPLTATEAALAACVVGGPTDASRLDPAVLDEHDRTLPHRLAARPGSLEALRALFAAGLDPRHPDEQGMPPLHIALWEGLPDHVAFLLTLPHDLVRRNGYGGDAMGSLMHGAEFCPSPGRDHLACARLLLEAGAVPDPEEVDACGDEGLVELLREHQSGQAADDA